MKILTQLREWLSSHNKGRPTYSAFEEYYSFNVLAIFNDWQFSLATKIISFSNLTLDVWLGLQNNSKIRLNALFILPYEHDTWACTYSTWVCVILPSQGNTWFCHNSYRILEFKIC